ncbi:MULTISPECIES: TIM barrel protein [Vibrio]|uniref:TIM barrel protein n=1 Tax=Vibrio TaxID=662 RepID=UPI0003B1DC43|nr:MULTISPECIES: TIM barrel protein [Vibrio]KJY81015.1 inosose dehydratase [Vibrio nigripulchritudo]UAB69158.1 TIM barrel protein [Vibrio sp. SCSIO 43132]CCN69485.1 putative Xylose isomerase [Vibrio nigripulchritudo SFn118]BDU36777.1 sugar phosphate isomerase/epimerase IoIE [Vibrio nigripulchritudo]BDU42487.1 sugar phosphate isomerase/epimerase IoIE [Vibrio nigripulchritudo]
MELKLANAPCSWGIEFPDNPDNPTWERVLNEISLSGYKATELGPLGYLPQDQQVLEKELSQRELDLIAGTLFVHLHRQDNREAIYTQTRKVCQILQQQNAKYLVVIDHVSSPRTDQAGQVDTATRLSPESWSFMMDTLKEVGRICADYGITPTLHPHAGTYIEYRDELDRAMNDLPPELMSLCVDTGHCIYAGMDPCEVLSTYRDRVKYLHFKDINAAVHKESVANGVDFYSAIGNNIFCPLGEGCVDFDAVKHTLIEIDFKGWVTVEQDTDPKAKSDAKTDAERSRTFIEQTILA